VLFKTWVADDFHFESYLKVFARLQQVYPDYQQQFIYA